jgi:hypothetical protein
MTELPSDIQHLLDSLDTDVALHLAARIKALMAAETERCAQIALQYRDEVNAGEHAGLGDPERAIGQGYAANLIGKRIRAPAAKRPAHAPHKQWGDDGSDQSDSPSPFLARLNGLRRATVENLRETLRGAHYTNIIVRAGGRDHYFEADWLHHALNILCKRHRGYAPPERTN